MRERKLVNIAFSLLLILYNLAAIDSVHGQDLGVFDTLKSIPKNKRSQVISKIYHEQIKTSLDSAFVCRQLDGLSKYALQTNDQKLAIRVLKYKGDFFWQHVKNGQDHGIDLYKKALDKAKKHELDNYVIKVSNHLGTRLLLMKRYEEGFTYVLQSDKLFAEIGYDNISDTTMSAVLQSIGWSYAMFSNYERAIQYYMLALKMIHSDTATMTMTYSNLGNAYLEKDKADSALFYYKQSLDVAKTAADSMTLALIHSNLGNAYHKLGKTNMARDQFNIAMHLSQGYNCDRCIASILISLAKVEMAANNFEIANENALKAGLLINSKQLPNDLYFWATYYQVLGEYNQHTGNMSQATAYLDTLVKIKDTILQQSKVHILANLETQLTAERHHTELEKIEVKQKKDQLIRNGIIVLLLLGSLIFYLFYSKWTLIKRKNLEVKLLEKEIEIKHEKNELTNAREQLDNYTANLKEKNALIEHLRNDIEKMHQKNILNLEETNQRAEMLEKLRTANILTEDDWIEFKAVFEKVHKNFFSNLLNDYPTLTISEVRFVALTKLDLSSNEMANMLGISPESVKRSIRRLRNKVNATSSLHFSELVKEI